MKKMLLMNKTNLKFFKTLDFSSSVNFNFSIWPVETLGLACIIPSWFSILYDQYICSQRSHLTGLLVQGESSDILAAAF